MQGSQTRLRTRVRELLGESAGPDIPGGLASVVLMDDFLKAMDQVSNVLQRIEKKRRARGRES